MTACFVEHWFPSPLEFGWGELWERLVSVALCAAAFAIITSKHTDVTMLVKGYEKNKLSDLFSILPDGGREKEVKWHHFKIFYWYYVAAIKIHSSLSVFMSPIQWTKGFLSILQKQFKLKAADNHGPFFV